MSGVGFDPVGLELFRSGLSILLVGSVIKLMDDFLDLRYDIAEGYEGLAVRLGEGTLPYALLLFALGAMCHASTAISLLLGAYVVGMAGEYDRPLPSGLKGYQEGALVLLVALLLLPWSDLLWALLAMGAVQILDDLHDYATDRITGNPNLARRFGVVELHFAGLLLLTVAAHLRPVGTTLLFLALPIVLAADQLLARPLPRTRGWGL